VKDSVAYINGNSDKIGYMSVLKFPSLSYGQKALAISLENQQTIALLLKK
jgi:hypothetical protein